jgi:hypothetical protein
MLSIIISIAAILLCVAVLNFLKYFFISKMRIDDRDQKVKLMTGCALLYSFL